MQDLLTPSPETLVAPSARSIARTALVAASGFAIYGMTVGFWRSPLMGLYVGVKMPLLIAVTLTCNGLLNGMLGLLLGSGLGFKQSLHALLSAFAVTGLILGSVAPVTLYLAINIPSVDSETAAASHAGYLLVHVFLIAIGGLAGVLRLAKLLETYCQNTWIACSTLAAWIAGNAFLGMQFSWVLRPFFGSPGLEVAFLREAPMKGSFYESVGRAFTVSFSKIPFENVSYALAAIGILTLIYFQNRKA